MKKFNIQKYASLILLLISIFFSCKKDKPVEVIISGEPVTDVDGNTYKTIKIGTQTWMAENLKVTKLNDGITSISFVTDPATWSDLNLSTPMTCYYNNDPVNMDQYGLLYNWDAVNTSKLAPMGWRIPTEGDITVLRNYLIANGYNYDGSKNEDKTAKSLASTSGWMASLSVGDTGNEQNTNNKTGFNGQATGVRIVDGSFAV